MWNRVNLRKKDGNLPSVGQRVIWATNEGSTNENVFHQFMGQITEDGKFIDYGYGRYKITGSYWWMLLPNNPELE